MREEENARKGYGRVARGSLKPRRDLGLGGSGGVQDVEEVKNIPEDV